MTTSFGKFTVQDVLKALRTTVIGAVIVALYTASQTPGFDILSVDWLTILKAGLTAGLYDLLGRTGTNADGKFLGVKVQEVKAQ